METMDKTLDTMDGLLVFGVHRSGVNALAGCLHQMGVNLGNSMLLPAAGQASPANFPLLFVLKHVQSMNV